MLVLFYTLNEANERSELQELKGKKKCKTPF